MLYVHDFLQIVWIYLHSAETHVRQEGGVAADATQADEELQGDFQVVGPFIITDEGAPHILHLWTRQVSPILHVAQRGKIKG